MPSLMRFLAFLAILAALIYGAMWLIVETYTPQPREISSSVPQDRLRQK